MGNPKLSLSDKDKKYIWHPFTQMEDWLLGNPLIIKDASGVYLRDTEGRRYIDGVSSLWVNVHGHRHPYLDKAINDQIKKVSHTTFLGLTHPKAVQLSEKLVSIAPKGLTKVFYSDSGSEAVEIALKMAFQYWRNQGNSKKTRFICLENAYHGDTMGAVSVGGIDLFHKIYKPLLFKSIKAPVFSVKKLESVLRKRHTETAALIMEPLVQAAGGIKVAPRGYFKKVRQLCSKHNVLFIADEVATGFGRTGKMFACNHEKVVPDLMCLGKGISGGYLPLAATLVKEKVYNAFLAPYKDKKTFFHGHTYTANPLSCAVSLANLELFEKNNVLEKLKPKIKLFAERLKEFWKLLHVGDVRQCGFMAGVELVKDRATKKPYLWEAKIGIKVVMEARKRGVIIRPLGNVIVVMPPLTIAKRELNKLLDIIYESIKWVTEK